MRATAEKFYSQNHLADLNVTSTYGLNKSDQTLIDSTKNIKKVEYSYLKDIVIKNTNTALRIFAEPKKLSTFEVISGRKPEHSNEISLDYLLKGKYKIGDTITFTEKKDNDKYVLKDHTFKIVGFVKSSEIVDKNNLGATNVGTGDLNGYGVVSKKVFASDVYMIARINFQDTANLNAYSDQYSDRIKTHKKKLQKLLQPQPKIRLASLKAKPQQKISQARRDIANAKEKINNSQIKLDQQKAQISDIPADMMNALNLTQEEINKSKAEINNQEKKLNKQQRELDDLALPEYTVNERTDNSGYQIYHENSKRIDILSNVFPVFLFAIAALVSLTTMTRFVEEQRINAGTLKALGYSNHDIKKKFIIYGLISSVLGATAGVVLGHLFLPRIIFNAYVASSTFSNIVLKFSFKYTLLAFAIAIICTVFSAYLVATQELTEQPAQLLLPKPPKAGSRILLERITLIWQHLSFNRKVAARNLFRYKNRMFMTILGVAGCTALLITGFGIKDSLAQIIDRQFNKVIQYDLIAINKDHLTNKEESNINKRLNDTAIKNSSSVYYEELTQTIDNNNQKINLVVPKNQKDFSKFIRLQNRKNQQKILLTNKGAVITEKLAKILHAKIGDTIKLITTNNQKISVTVAGITEMYMGHYLFMDSEEYRKILRIKFTSNAHLIKLKNHSENNIKDVAAKFIATNGIKGVQQNIELRAKIDSIIDGLGNVIIVLILIATLLAVVVIYNLTNINVSERIRELSTIKVLGFYDQEVTMYIYRETIILSLLGILSGYIVGSFLHSFIIISLPPDDAMFDPYLWLSNFIISTVMTMLITFAIAIVMHEKIKHVNMLDALKSVD